MDLDFLNLAPDAQMDLINMMIHMDKQLFDHQQPISPPNIISTTTHHHPASSLYNNSYITEEATHVQPFTSGGATAMSMSFDCHNQASVAAMREMIFRIAAMQPIHIDPESVKPPKRRNVRISKDPQSVAARHRRERISERIRILQRLVPGGTKMDTASMLDEAIHYVKFLKSQVQSLERAAAVNRSSSSSSTGTASGLGFGPGNMMMVMNGGHYSNMNHAYANNVDC